jgi:hypothetical protein
MEMPGLSNDTTAEAGTLVSLHPDSRQRRVALASACARFGCEGLLFLAATLKTHQLFTDPALLHGSRWLATALVEYELLLALWLLSGVGLQWGRRIALVTFLGFGCYSFFLGLSGRASCGCFGKAPVNPWWTFGIDAALVLLLFVWKPRGGRKDRESASGYVPGTASVALVTAALFAILGIAPFVMAVRAPESGLAIEDALANSPFVVLEPENWIGKPFPLTGFIDLPERVLDRGLFPSGLSKVSASAYQVRATGRRVAWHQRKHAHCARRSSALRPRCVANQSVLAPWTP